MTQPTESSVADLDARTQELDREHVFHSWMMQSAQATAALMPIAGGEGTRVWTHSGKSYLDFSSQLVNVNIGHQHPAVVAAIQEQAATLATIGPATANLTRGVAAQRIAARAPEGFNKVFFTNGGADANENAIRMARLHTGRDKVVSTYRSYHGNTGGAIVATGDWRRIPNEYARAHVHVFGPYLYRSEFWATTPEEESERALRHLRRVIESEGAATVAAILLETIPGTAGIMMPPPGYLEGVRELADEFGIMLILDEVMAGFGRAGEWFALDAYDVVPDLITFAKGVNSGYVPIGGVIISDPIARTFDDRVFPGGLTYSGHPLGAASIVASIDAMDSEGIIAHAKQIGAELIGPGLEKLADKHPVIGEVRGTGVFWAMELVADATTREPLSAALMGRAKGELVSRGVLPFIADNRIHVVPPCVVTADEVAEAMAAYDEVLTLLDEEL
jgi:taurine--2-oxoglutarate transaminase